MLKRDLSGLPAATGLPPDPEPRFITALLETWHQQYLARGWERDTAAGTELRGSDAGQCSRYLAYELERRRNKTPQDPPDLPSAFRFELGTLVHDVFQAALVERFPGCEIEKVGVHKSEDVSLHADAFLTHDGKRVAIELKTVGGFGYKKMAVGTRNDPPEGPRLTAILQGSLAALAFDADELVVAYLGLELVSPAEAERRGLPEVGRIGSEWTFTREEFEPMARAELARLDWVRTTPLEGVPRVIPGLPVGAEVVDPSSGRWVARDGEFVSATGLAWQCSYCSMRDRCVSDLKGETDG